MCNKCLIYLAKSLSIKAQDVFNIIAQEGKINKTDIEKTLNITFVAKTLGPAKKLRTNEKVFEFIDIQKDFFNKYYKDIQNELDGREFNCQIIKKRSQESLENGLKTFADHDLQKKTEKSSNSFTVKGL
ncbi:MAG: hypothetical protein ACOCP8_00640 [archaeon]